MDMECRIGILNGAGSRLLGVLYCCRKSWGGGYVAMMSDTAGQQAVFLTLSFGRNNVGLLSRVFPAESIWNLMLNGTFVALV